MSASAPRLAKPSTLPASSRTGGLLQRKCACGGQALAGGECEECRKSKLQRKLAIGAEDDPLEREADRVAEQVLSGPAPGAPAYSPVRVQRFTGSAGAGAATAPASVDHALASPGQPLQEDVRQDMERHFAHDFSEVRVHTDSASAQSARDVNAHAYTVGREIVFGAGLYAPHSTSGRRLLAHELTHVAQQGAARGAALQRAPATGTAPRSPAYLEPGWKIINKPGIVRVEKTKATERGARLRPEPNPPSGSTANFVHLDENTHVVVVSADPKSGWCFVQVTDGTYIAHSGYVASWLIHTNLPDPGAIEYYIDKPGLKLQWLVENHPHFQDYDIKTGDDARTLVMAVFKANEEYPIENGKTGVYLNPEKLAEAKSAGLLTRAADRLDEYRRIMRPILQSIELRRETKIWLPGPSYIDSLKDKGIIPERPAWKNALVKVTKGIGGFVSGLVQGFFGSIIDLFVGIYDLIKTILSTVRDLFTDELFDKAQDIYDAILKFLEEKTPGEVLSTITDAIGTATGEMWTSFKNRWSSNNFFDKWNFRGRVIGYIAAEILMAVFSGGASLAAKLLGKLGKVGKILSEILSKILNKVDDILDAVPGRKRSKQEPSGHGDGKDSKSRQLPMALTKASIITEVNDKADTPARLAVLALEPLRLTYKWITGFAAEPRGPGRSTIVMFGSRHVVDDDYTAKDETPDKTEKPDTPLGRNSPPTKEPLPNKPETGAELEKRMLDPEGAVPAPSKTFLGWKGGTRDFNNLVKTLTKHAQQFQTGVKLPRTKVLTQSTRDFIKKNRALKQIWDAEEKEITDAIGRMQKAMRDNPRDGLLRKRHDDLQKHLAKRNDWANGNVGKKRPDLVEVHIDKNGISSIDVTDITQIPFDPSHNFKTRFYVEVTKRITGVSRVSGTEFKSVHSMKRVTR